MTKTLVGIVCLLWAALFYVEAQNAGPKKKESLLLKEVPKKVKTLCHFPYPKDERKVADSLADFLNSSEDLLEQASKLGEGEYLVTKAIVVHHIALLELSQSLAQLRVAMKNVELVAHYQIVWDGGRWKVATIGEKREKDSKKEK